MKKAYILLTTLIFVLGCRTNTDKASSKIRNKNPVHSNAEIPKGATFIKELEELEYFKLTEPDKVSKVKIELLETLEEHNFFLTKTEDESFIYLDHRFYSIDSEDLFEIGGLIEYLELVRPSFNKLGLAFDFKNEVSLDVGDYWKHTIEINGRLYNAFDSPFNDDEWELAYANFIEMLNSELAIQGSDEKFYAIRSGNDGSIVMLTNQQFFLITTSYPSPQDNPIELADWKKLIRLK